MAGREYKSALLITGDASGAQKAIKLTEEQLSSLKSKIADTGTSSFKLSGDWQKQFTSMSASAAKWGAATAAAAATGAALFVKSAIDQADAAGILAGKLGITTEALTKLEYAAKLSDVSQQALEGGLKKLSVTLTNAQDPASKAAQALRAIGLSASELIALPADQQLGRIGDALNGVENASQRAALAQKIFGKAGVDLLPVLAEGSAGIRQLGDEAQRLGVVISGDLASRAGVFNDQLDRLKSAAEGVGLAVADQLLEPMNGLTQELIDLAQEKETADGIATFITAIGTAVVWTANAISATTNTFKFLAEELAATINGPAFGDIPRITDAIAELDNQIAVFQQRLSRGETLNVVDQQQLDALNTQRVEMERLRTESEKMVVSQQQSAAATQKVVDIEEIDIATLPRRRIAIVQVTEASKAAAAAAEAHQKRINDTISQLQFEAVQLTKTAREQRIATALRNADVTAASAQGRQIAELTGLLFDHEEAMKRNKAALDEMDKGMADLEGGMTKTAEVSDPWAEALKGAVERVDSAFVDMWKNIGSGFDSFADSLKEAFKQLLAELAHLAITRKITMQLSAAFGLGGGSSGALAGGGGGGIGLGSIGSLVSGAKNFLGGFQSGGLSGGIDALMGSSSLSGNWLGTAMSDFRFALGDASKALGFDGLAGQFNNAGLGIQTFGQSLVDLGLSAGAGFAGNYVGNKLGQSLFGERKTTGIGGGIGGVIGGAFGGAPGAFIGSFLGSIAENAIGKIFGTGDLVKWGKLGITTGGGSNIPNDGSALQTITGASGLTLTAVAKRTDADAAKQLLEGFNAIDSALTEAARAAGVTVDFANKVLGNTSLNVDNQGAKNSFGVGARLDEFSAEKIKGSADDFARAWIAEIDDQLTGRIKTILSDTSKRTAEQIVQLFGFASKLDKLLKLDVLKEVADAAATKTQTLLDAYNESTDALITLAHEYDGTLESMTSLTDALTGQKQVAAQLAVAYQEVSALVDATFGNAISTIEDSMLSEADLYQKRRQQIASLTDELANTVDPSKIASLVQQIDTLAGAAFQMLDETQRKQMGQEFIDFLQQAQTIADQQIQAGRDSLAGRETAVAGAIDLEVLNTAALTQQAAADTFAGAVDRFAGLIGLNQLGIDPAAIAAYLKANGVEVNV